MTHPSPEAVEANTNWAMMIASHLTHIPAGDRSQRERALVFLSEAVTALTAQLEAERAKVAELTGKMVDCGDVTVNRDHVVSLGWDRRHYMNGSHSWFVVKTIAGDEIRIEYRPQGYGPDPYKIEKELRGA